MSLADIPSFTDRPFAPPLDIEIDLPYPPSTNRIWRNSKKGQAVTLSAEYCIWRDQADKLLMLLGSLRGITKITAAFEATIILRREGKTGKDGDQRGDLDNRIKAVLDYAQRVEVISNDKFCERLLVEWGTAPHGCRLILRPREAA